MKCTLLILTLIFFFPGNIVNASENEEIEYLLSYTAASNCIFIRNGKEHPATEAREHLEMKYNHVKRHIKTAEDFIDKIASKSSLSRKEYAIRCDGVQQQARLWLTQVLAGYRAGNR